MIVKVLYPQKGSCLRTQNDNMDHSLLWLNISQNSLHEFHPRKRTTANHFKPPSAKAAKVQFLYLLKSTKAKHIPSYLATLTQKPILEAFDLNTLTVLRADPYQAFSQDSKSVHPIYAIGFDQMNSFYGTI